MKPPCYGFVVSGGVELPGLLTIATDRVAYIQAERRI